MVKGIASCGVAGFLLLAACGAVCQSGRDSLPDAPSAVAERGQGFIAFVEEARSTVNVAGTNMAGMNVVGMNMAGTSGGAMSARGWSMRQGGLFSDRSASRHKDADAIVRKYLYSPSVKPQPNPVSGESLVGRATHAASGAVVTRNESGKSRLNTSYLLRTLTAVAKDSASTPYWRRSPGAPLSDFGSTVGNDAGMNLWHEFGPSIEHLLKNHTPGFVSRIEEYFGRG
jgi:hypothetical protein